ncbi:unnamed protein product [Larinioides sclopetarius]|uniref:Pre-mRNA-splicing factor 38 n=1 Tax=Larinioides sclopetarius TaxID=280406 RepID=A0AAV2BPN9_9ARAC
MEVEEGRLLYVKLLGLCYLRFLLMRTDTLIMLSKLLDFVQIKTGGRKGGSKDNPDTFEFRHTIHKVIIANFIKTSNGKNCQDDDAYTLIDFSSVNKNEIFDILNSEDCAEESEQDVDDLK